MVQNIVDAFLIYRTSCRGNAIAKFGWHNHAILAFDDERSRFAELPLPGFENQMLRHQQARSEMISLPLCSCPGLARSTYDRRSVRPPEQCPLHWIVGKNRPMQIPMPAPFMSERKAIARLHRGADFRIEALVNHDPAIFEKDGAENIGIAGGFARYPEKLVCVVKLNAQFEMLLDDVLYWDWWGNDDAASLRVFSQ